ncbi:MAG: hypothetical protein KIS91_16410 [Anaerolineae bacterium]|nr:hypothetical protein [Anaerolineae bacterium]
MPRRPWSWNRTTIGIGIALSLLAEAVVSSLLKGGANGPGLLAASGSWWGGVPAITRALASFILLVAALAFLAARRWHPPTHHRRTDGTNTEAP